MNLGAFHTLVSSHLRRGTTLDSVIPDQVKLAVQWLERNYTFKYMEAFRLLQLVAGDRTIVMPTNAIIKAFKFVRLIGEDGAYIYLNKIEPEDMGRLRAEAFGDADVVPRGYWMAGTSTMVFDSVPSEALNGEAVWHQYSDWPVATSETHPLLGFASDVLLMQSLFNMAIYLRDATMVQFYKAARDEAVNTLTRAEDETKYGGESISMAYVPPNS